jgi:hypothetical protein
MWAQLASAALGIWLMASPAILGFGDPSRTNNYIIGPFVAGLAGIATAQVMRPVRWANLPIGLWLVLAPFILGYGGVAAANSILLGLLLAALAFVRGKVDQRFGGGWSSLLPGRSPHEE